MKLLSVPLTAALSCIATNYYNQGKQSAKEQHHQPADQHPVAEEVPPPVASEADPKQELDAAHQQRISDLEMELQELRQQQAEPAKSADPLEEIMFSAAQVQACGADLARFAFESLAELLWPWPVDGAAAALLASSGGGQMSELLESLPKLHLEDVHAQLVSHASDAVGTIGAVLPDDIRAGCLQTWGRAQHLARMGMIETRLAVDAARKSLAVWLQGFLERFPQHGAMLRGRDPLIVVLACLLLASVVAVQLYTTLRFLCRVAFCCLRGLCHLLLLPLRCCCCCGRSHGKGIAREQQPNADASKGREAMSEKGATFSSAALKSEL